MTGRPTRRSPSPHTTSVRCVIPMIASVTSRPASSDETSDSVAYPSDSTRQGCCFANVMFSRISAATSGRMRAGSCQFIAVASAISRSTSIRDHIVRSSAVPTPGMAIGAKRLSISGLRCARSDRAEGSAGAASTTASTRSDISGDARTEISPPIELPWRITRSRPSASSSAGRNRAFARTRAALARGGTVRPKPGRSIASTARSTPRSGITSNQFVALPPSPCTSRWGVAGESCASIPFVTRWTAVPRTSTTPLRRPAQRVLRAPRSPSGDAVMGPA